MKNIQVRTAPQGVLFDMRSRASDNNSVANEIPEKLLERIRELEAEIREREKDVAKYRDELAKANVRLETLINQIMQEVKLAHSIQKTLVPTEFPNVPGFEFSTKFVASMVQGGDYFDIFSHEDRLRFGIVVAAGSGHSMSALFLSVLLKYTGQMEARKGAEPPKIMRRLVDELIPNIEAGSRADIFYGLVDRRTYELSYSRLGEVTALHQSFTDGELKVLESTGPTISPDFNCEIKAGRVSLHPRDKLIFCTPGVLAGKSLAGEPFGLPRLSRSIVEGGKRGVHEIRNQILYDLQKFTGGQEPTRDLTVVVVEVKDKVIMLAKN